MSDQSDRNLPSKSSKAGHSDRELGMGAKITRRDFLNGIAVTAGASMIPAEMWASAAADLEAQNAPGYYPPTKTDMRGSHPGSFEAMHKVRDGDFWQDAGKPVDTGEVYDLVIVGGGISGLSAAHFFRKVVGDSARILIIENHDDFGGHAKRNEFGTANHTLIGYGGTYAIESPAPYSPVAKGVIEELGIDVPAYSTYLSKGLYRSFGMRSKVFFDKETFGADKLVVNPAPWGANDNSDNSGMESARDSATWKQFFAEAPLSEEAKRGLERLHWEAVDYFPGLTSTEKKARLARISYANYLKDLVKANDEVVRLYQARPHPWFGVGIDAVSAQDAWGLGAPGFIGLNLDPAPGKGMNRDCIPNAEAEKYFFHFPDGNASIARMLVRKIIPSAIPGNSASDIVLGHADYSKLDQESWPVRIRLNSTAVRVKHIGDPATAKEVEITYFSQKKVKTVRAANCILACWHVVIPYIAQELPDSQKEALASAQKVPLLYTNVVIRNWTSFQKLGTNAIHSPGMYFTGANLDLPVSIGGYECPKKPEEAIVVHMMKAACKPGLPARDQHRAGRIQLFMTSFRDYERNIREQLLRMLGAGGFDPAHDIQAITVNRWPHGYAYEYNSLFDKFWLEGTEAPCQVARKPFGRITIANADADAYAYTDCAIDQAYRAVQELRKS